MDAYVAVYDNGERSASVCDRRMSLWRRVSLSVLLFTNWKHSGFSVHNKTRIAKVTKKDEKCLPNILFVTPNFQSLHKISCRKKTNPDFKNTVSFFGSPIKIKPICTRHIYPRCPRVKRILSYFFLFLRIKYDERHTRQPKYIGIYALMTS